MGKTVMLGIAIFVLIIIFVLLFATPAQSTGLVGITQTPTATDHEPAATSTPVAAFYCPLVVTER